MCVMSDILSLAPENFYREEIRSGYRISPEMKKIWACQLNLLAELQKVCDRNGLKYWLDSGSLLGAIRHQGYIPWDDDIDVVMFRDDYDRLVKLSKEEFRPPFVFQTAYSEKEFVRGHAQLRDTRTSAIIPSEIHKSFNQGVFIDIFVLDGASNEPEKEERQLRKAKHLRRKLELLACPIRSQSLKNIPTAIKYKILYPGFKNKIRIYRKYENIFRGNKISECDYVYTATFRALSKKRDRHIYDKTLMMDFEYMKQPVPAGYDKLLKLLYGDYMKPVMCPSMHGTLILDPDTPADIKIKELRKRKCKR